MYAPYIFNLDMKTLISNYYLLPVELYFLAFHNRPGAPLRHYFDITDSNTSA